MKVCLICVEIFAWGKYGGLGRATRIIGRELVKRGVEVSAVVPRRSDQRAAETLDGIRVLSFPRWLPPSMIHLLRECDADIYHSQNPSLGTWLALRAMPDRLHVTTFRDPKEKEDWRIEFMRPSRSRMQVIMNWMYEDSGLVHRAVRQQDGKYCAAEFLNPKLRRKFRFSADLPLLPTPVEINSEAVKADSPTVCFVGRWDRRKRPELFFELAPRFPHVRFIAVGQASDPRWERQLRRRYAGIANLDLLGFVDQFRSAGVTELLARSWILVNTADREGLPTVFLEALANRCAILSHVDPEHMAARFGYHARSAADFERGLATLLAGDTWRKKGEAGFAHVRRHFEIGRVIDLHLEAYRSLMEA